MDASDLIPEIEFQSPRRRAGGVWRLWLYGIAMLFPTTWFARRYPLRGHTNVLTDIGKMSHYSTPDFWAYTLGLGSIFVLYLLGIWETRRIPARSAMPPVFVCGSLAVLIFATMYPVNAIDLFIYAVRSRLWTHYGANPIAVTPDRYFDDPWRHFASEWSSSVSPYGPLWNWVAAPATAISGDRLGVALFGLKFLAAAAIIGGAWLIARTAAVDDPQRRASAALLYLWNPLILWEGAGNGHNDVIMVLPLLGSLLAWKRRRYSAIVPLIVAAALIKYVAILLLPIAAIAIFRSTSGLRERVRIALWSAISSAVLVTFSLAPFFDVTAIRDSINAQKSIVMTSPEAMAIGLWQHDYTVRSIEHWSQRIGMGLFGAAFIVIALVTWLKPERFPRACFELFCAYLLFLAATFRPWYVIWVVAIAAVLPVGWATARSTIWSLTSVGVYGLFIWGWNWWRVDFYTIQNVAVPMMFGPPLLIASFEALSALFRRFKPAARSALPNPRSEFA